MWFANANILDSHLKVFRQMTKFTLEEQISLSDFQETKTKKEMMKTKDQMHG